MANSGSEFWSIMENNFVEAKHDHYVEIRQDLDSELERQQQIKKDERISRIIEAATDPNIADYFVKGSGTEEALIAYLERVYGLTEAEVLSAIDLAIGNLHEITDYGEA
jgi:hypothetical protein